VKGLEDAKMPAVGRLSAGRLGYYIRAGRHSMTPEDWRGVCGYPHPPPGKPGGTGEEGPRARPGPSRPCRPAPADPRGGPRAGGVGGGGEPSGPGRSGAARLAAPTHPEEAMGDWAPGVLEGLAPEVLAYAAPPFVLKDDLLHLTAVYRAGAPEAVILYCTRIL